MADGAPEGAAAVPPGGADAPILGGGEHGLSFARPLDALNHVLATGWGFMQKNGWYVVAIAVLLYLIYDALKPRLQAAYRAATALPPVQASQESVLAARARQQEEFLRRSAAAKQLREDERRQAVLEGRQERRVNRPTGQDMPRPNLSSSVWGGDGNGGGGDSCRWRPGNRRPRGG